MKKFIIPVLLILPIGILVFVNYLYPLLVILSHSKNLVFSNFNYFFIITSYVCVIFTVWIERENLASWNLDRSSIFVLVLVAFVRAKLHISHEENYQNWIKLLGLVLLGVFIINWKKNTSDKHTLDNYRNIGLCFCNPHSIYRIYPSRKICYF